MEPVYLDLHIHTSDDPNSLNQNYDLDTLISKVKETAKGDAFLISLTDHNVINKKAYLEAVQKIKTNIILGVELHIRTSHNETPAYHCHIYFDLEEITAEIIGDINTKLDGLYPNKQPELKDTTIPQIERILETFDEYDFLLLPHGGQTHATFDQAMPDGKEFDNVMQRSIYYNFFDGFTSRSDKKTEKTKAYLEKLGVQEFVNLVTCTDNYTPTKYPQPKSEETYKFIPTWMFATPTFGGLRLSLSDSSRLVYSNEKPKKWRESIRSIRLQNEKVDIDAQLTPGLNVIIGESSSGKTLLADSIYRKITKSFSGSVYQEFGIDSLTIDFPDNLEPYFIAQNFIINVTREDKKINDIEIIGKIIPENTIARRIIDKGLEELKDELGLLFDTVEQIENLDSEIKRIPILSSLVTSEQVKENPLKRILDIVSSSRYDDYSEFDKDKDVEFLNNLEKKLATNPFIKHNPKLTEELKAELLEMRSYSSLEGKVVEIITNSKRSIDKELKEKEGDSQNKKQNFDSLLNLMSQYYKNLEKFERSIRKISGFSIESKSSSVTIKGHKLSVENTFKLDKNILEDELNSLLLKDKAISNIDTLSPESLFKGNFKNNRRGIEKGGSATYKTIKDNIYTSFFENDKVSYKIMTPDGSDFDNLSPGLKTSILLELILNFEDDDAPLIIDQPEDNLATSYMNDGLVKSIKAMKTKKQIIFVSHNATIPMAGDAQNIILCENKGGKIVIRSSPLEGKINGIDVVDYIARIADGGKSSIKKRFKKYNLKKFREETT